MTEIANLDMIARTTAKFMDTLERELGDMEDPKIVHVCVIADVHYSDGEKGVQNHVILETEVDERIIQIGITTAAANAALFGEPMGDDDD